MSEIPKGLVERIEAATGPDRGLDCEIGVAVGRFEPHPEKYPGAGTRYIENDGAGGIWPGNGPMSLVPRYTTSIDVAMTLIPDDATGWSLNNDRLENEALVFRTGDGVIGRGNASSSALALCCASLRAHMSQENPNGSQ